MRTKPAAAGVFLTLLYGAAASAQTSGSEPRTGLGARVRVTITSIVSPQELIVPLPGSRLVGLLTHVDEHALTIRQDGGAAEITVPRVAVARLERSVGQRSRARYAGVGTLIGLGVGVIAGLASSAGCQPSDWFCSAEWNASAFGVLGGVAGAVTGAMLPPAPRWVEVRESTLSEIPESVRPTAPPVTRRWAWSADAGVAQGGPAADLEAAMRQAGFGDTVPAFIFPASATPHSSAWFGQSFDAHYQIRPSWEIGLTYTRTTIRHTDGFHGPSSQFLFVDYAVIGVAAVASRTFGPARIGIGPAWYSARSNEEHAGQSTSRSRYSRLGVLAQTGLRLPVHTRLYLDLNLQYRYVGRATVGPFTPPPLVGVASQFPETDVPFSHWFVGVGPGLRF